MPLLVGIISAIGIGAYKSGLEGRVGPEVTYEAGFGVAVVACVLTFTTGALMCVSHVREY